MEKGIEDFLSGVKLGEVCTHKNFTVLPVFSPHNGGPLYRTLEEALQQGTLTISEMTTGGSVPELKVINRGDVPVLLLDGEELAGAKQNRVLNTSILLDIDSETTIPVSCTEHGRCFDAEKMVGSALELDGHVIHTAFFPISQSEKMDPMAGYQRRRAYRTRNEGGAV